MCSTGDRSFLGDPTSLQRQRLRVHLGVTPALFTTSCRGKTVDTTATVKRFALDGSHSTTVLLLWSTCCTFAFHTFLGHISKHNQIAIANDLIPYSRNSPQTEKSIPNEWRSSIPILPQLGRRCYGIVQASSI